MYYTCKKIDFKGAKGPLVNGVIKIPISWSELVWSAITVGRMNYHDVIRHGKFSELEMIYRSIMLYANLKEHNQQIAKSSAFRDLDPSEKGALSFFIGQIIAKHVSCKLFKIPWLMHLDRYQSSFHVRRWPGKTKPDFIGKNSQDEWLILESKGRSNYADDALARYAKGQTRHIRQINGHMPIWRISTVAYFDNDILQATICDPDGYVKGAPDIEISDNDFLSSYYDSLFDGIARSSSSRTVAVNGNVYQLTPFGDIDLELGMNEDLLRYRESSRFPETVRRLASQYYSEEQLNRESNVHFDNTEYVSSDTFQGPDGILVRLGRTWDSLRMNRNPGYRSHE
jgi:hypothetical protein